MDEYVSKSQLYQFIGQTGVARIHVSDVDMMKPADVANITSCKNCIFYHDGHCENENMNQNDATWLHVKPDWYCCHACETPAYRMAQRLKARHSK